ncbi:MAG: ArgE/DapE family deacylase [Candidatus Solibacter sp.]
MSARLHHSAIPAFAPPFSTIAIMQIDRKYTVETLARLVQINSVNPALAPGAPGETEIAAYVAESLRAAGLAVEILEPVPGRPSVLGRIPGSGGGRGLMFNAHCDTVDVAGMAEPFSGAIRDGKLYGRGAYDMKGSLAACMAAAKALNGLALRGDVLVAAVADEEYGSLGTSDLLSRVRPDAAIVTEPTALDVCLAHKGYLWIEVAVTGRAAHGSRFELGIDANMKMGRFLAELAHLERDLRTRPPHALVGPPSMHAATLHGGSGLSTYAASCTLEIERRTVPGETGAQAVAEIQAIVDRLSAVDPDFHAAVRPFFARDPFEVPPGAAIVQAVGHAAARVRGMPARHVGDTPWMDAALLQAAGVETVVFGPAGAGAHADVEWVDVESVLTLAEILCETAIDYCA